MAPKQEQLFLVARALADPIRIKILRLLAIGKNNASTTCCPLGLCVCDLQEALNMKQSKVSYHLKELKNADLIQERKEGKWNYYTINPPVFHSFCQVLQDHLSLEPPIDSAATED